MTRYNPFLVALHWVLAIMILVALLVGGPGLAALAHDDPTKMFGLTGHMIWGLVIGVLMLIRLVIRLRSKTPPAADAGHWVLNLGARTAHWGLYVLVLTMVASGIGIAISADLFAIVFGGSGAPLPESFHIYAPRIAHGLIATLILLLVAAHLVGWAFHQFILRDGLIRRMWFGNRTD